MSEKITAGPFPGPIEPGPIPDVTPLPIPKPTWQSTEFWSGIVGNLLGILVLLGVFSPDQASDITTVVGEVAGGIIIAVSNGTYAISRGLAKNRKG